MNVKEFLNKYLNKNDLEWLAMDYDLPHSGTKLKIIDRIVINVPFEDILYDLLDDELEDICNDLNLPIVGRSAEDLVDSIVNKITGVSKDTTENKSANGDASATIKVIREWIPRRRYRNEDGYQADLAAYLNGKGFNVKMEAGETNVDILVNYSIPIELKKNPNQSSYDRLMGQTSRNIRAYGSIIVVICDVTRGEQFEDFKHIISSRFSESEVAIIQKNKD